VDHNDWANYQAKLTGEKAPRGPEYHPEAVERIVEARASATASSSSGEAATGVGGDVSIPSIHDFPTSGGWKAWGSEDLESTWRSS